MDRTDTIRQRQQDTALYEQRTRAVNLTKVECREAADGTIELAGEAAVFDVLSEMLHDGWGPFRERIQRGFFKDVLGPDNDCRFLALNHNRDLPGARVGNGDLKLFETARALEFEVNLAPTTFVRDLVVLIERRVVHQMSFTFSIVQPDGDRWEFDGETEIRTLRRCARLFDISPVVFPAYTQTSVAMRALGVELVGTDGSVRESELRDLADKIHRGELRAAPADLAAIDQAYAAIDGVSPWVLQRAARALSQEPDEQGSTPREQHAPSQDAPRGDDEQRAAVEAEALALAAARDRALRLAELA